MSDSVAAIYLPLRATRLSRPVLSWRIPAGFPSPAEDYIEGRIDLNRDLVKHPLATFYIRVTGKMRISYIWRVTTTTLQVTIAVN